MSVGENIKKIRKRKKLTQVDLGERLGVSAAMIASWENGVRNPKMETLIKIAQALGVDVFDIIPPTTTTAEKMRTVLNAKGKSIEWLSQETNIPIGSITEVLNGGDSFLLGLNEYQRIANALNVDLSEINRLASSTISFLKKQPDLETGLKKLADMPYEITKFYTINSSNPTNATLVRSYKTLNQLGKEEAAKRVEELTHIEKYIKKDSGDKGED